MPSGKKKNIIKPVLATIKKAIKARASTKKFSLFFDMILIFIINYLIFITTFLLSTLIKFSYSVFARLFNSL